MIFGDVLIGMHRREKESLSFPPLLSAACLMC